MGHILWHFGIWFSESAKYWISWKQYPFCLNPLPEKFAVTCAVCESLTKSFFRCIQIQKWVIPLNQVQFADGIWGVVCQVWSTSSLVLGRFRLFRIFRLFRLYYMARFRSRWNFLSEFCSKVLVFVYPSDTCVIMLSVMYRYGSWGVPYMIINYCVPYS